MIKVSHEGVSNKTGDSCFSSAVRMSIKENTERDRVLCGFMALEKVYDRVNRKGLWYALRIYSVGRRFLKGIRSFYRVASALV